MLYFTILNIYSFYPCIFKNDALNPQLWVIDKISPYIVKFTEITFLVQGNFILQKLQFSCLIFYKGNLLVFGLNG